MCLEQSHLFRAFTFVWNSHLCLPLFGAVTCVWNSHLCVWSSHFCLERSPLFGEVTFGAFTFALEKVGRQHQGMDRPGVRQVPEGSGEQGKMEKTGCKIICGAPTTFAVKGSMMMMMMMIEQSPLFGAVAFVWSSRRCLDRSSLEQSPLSGAVTFALSSHLCFEQSPFLFEAATFV